MTALFVAIFLFFLSVALLWTNRQDIALSLSMEHKLKAQSAARSLAMETYAKLRRLGEAESLEKGSPSGATARVEIRRVPAKDRHGQMLLVRSRGQSGPVSSFYTLHLLESNLASDAVEAASPRFLALTNGPAANAIYGDFKLSELTLGGSEEVAFAAYQGPMFSSDKAAQSREPFAVLDYLPVFTNGAQALKAFGPGVMVGPTPTDSREIQMLEHDGTEFKWSPIEGPDELDKPKQQSFEGAIAAAEFKAAGSDWTNLSARAVGDLVAQFSWKDQEPSTQNKEEMENMAMTQSFEIDLANASADWSEVPRLDPINGYSLRGTIAAHGNTVYSHAWHYLYRQYGGRAETIPVDEFIGVSVTRWPCILKYDTQGDEWEVAWSSLDDSGDVKSPQLPDPSVLLVDSGGKFYSRTTDTPKRLLTLDGKNTTLGNTLPEGQMFLYQDQPYAATERGLVNLATNNTIGFETLVSRLPEITGMAVADEGSLIVGAEDLEGEAAGAGAALSADNPTLRTTRPQYDFTYSVEPGVVPAADDKDLWLTLKVQMVQNEPTYPLLGNPPYPAATEVSALARFDGERWHILPNGLRALLQTEGLAAPSTARKLYAPRYAQLPAARARYTVLSISTEAFDFQ